MICPKKLEYSKIVKEKYQKSLLTSLISHETRLILKNLLISLIEAEINLETKKKKINSITGYSNYDSYETIKGKYKSFILKNDVIF